MTRAAVLRVCDYILDWLAYAAWLLSPPVCRWWRPLGRLSRYVHRRWSDAMYAAERDNL